MDHICWWVVQLMTVIAIMVSMPVLYCTVLYCMFASISMDKDKRKRRHVCTGCSVACEEPLCDSSLSSDGFITPFIQTKQRVTSGLIPIRMNSQGSVWIKICLCCVNQQSRWPWESSHSATYNGFLLGQRGREKQRAKKQRNKCRTRSMNEQLHIIKLKWSVSHLVSDKQADACSHYTPE